MSSPSPTARAAPAASSSPSSVMPPAMPYFHLRFQFPAGLCSRMPSASSPPSPTNSATRLRSPRSPIPLAVTPPSNTTPPDSSPNILDVIGLSSTLAYTPGTDFINALTTPYGTTSFVNNGAGTDRWLEATDPAGHKERVVAQQRQRGDRRSASLQ